jgi:DNA transformation protein
MPPSSDYVEYVLEQLAPFGRVRASRLFGGIGLSRGSVMFGAILGNTLYFVVDDATRPRYESAGMAPFEYDTKQRRVTVRRFYSLPEDVLEDRDELARWAEAALDVAARTPRKKKARRRS